MAEPKRLTPPLPTMPRLPPPPHPADSTGQARTCSMISIWSRHFESLSPWVFWGLGAGGVEEVVSEVSVYPPTGDRGALLLPFQLLGCGCLLPECWVLALGICLLSLCPARRCNLPQSLKWQGAPLHSPPPPITYTSIPRGHPERSLGDHRCQLPATLLRFLGTASFGA